MDEMTVLKRAFPCRGAARPGLALLFLLFVAGLSYAAEPAPIDKPPAAREMTVHVASGQIRQSPSAVSPILASVQYRQKLQVLGVAKGWAKVALPGIAGYGYIYASALSPVALPQGSASPSQGAAPGVSGTEISLAGKGFSAELEQGQGGKGSGFFAWVDFMEGFEYQAETCIGFISGKGTQ